MAKEEARQERGTVGWPRINKYNESVLTNWTSPLLWIHIEKVASYCRPEMRPSMIVKELQKLDPILFKKIRQQTVGGWIDQTGEAPQWSDSTLKRVAAGHKPGGLTTRVGILVSSI